MIYLQRIHYTNLQHLLFNFGCTFTYGIDSTEEGRAGFARVIKTGWDRPLKSVPTGLNDTCILAPSFLRCLLWANFLTISLPLLTRVLTCTLRDKISNNVG